jgi:non-specific serine/threonine protein kinase
VYVALYLLGDGARATGDHARAERLLRDAHMRMGAAGDAWSSGFAILSLGRLAWDRGDHLQAVDLHLDGLRYRQQTDDAIGTSYCLDALAMSAQAAGDMGQAASLFGTAARLRAPTGADMWPPWSADVDRAVQAFRQSLGLGFEDAWNSGRGWTADELFAEAATVRELVGASSNQSVPRALSSRSARRPSPR